MDFFNKAKESLTNAGKDITQKASDAGGLAKVTVHLSQLDKSYNEQLKKLAETLYLQHYAEVKSMCPELIHNLDQNRKDYETSKKEQATLKGMRICPNCGAEQAKLNVRCTDGARFCMSCGTPVDCSVLESVLGKGFSQLNRNSYNKKQ